MLPHDLIQMTISHLLLYYSTLILIIYGHMVPGIALYCLYMQRL